MRQVDLPGWARHEHFRKFSSWDSPHFSMCAPVNLRAFYPAVKQRGLSLNVAIMYVISRAANAIPEFRYRIRPGMVVEHQTVSPSTTILMESGLFSFCTVDYVEDFAGFAARAAERVVQAKARLTLEDEPGRDDLLFMTAIPWVAFTSFMHPIHLHPVDSVPRFAWGKFFQEGEALKMPLSVQGHHALMDGIHIGRHYALVQEYLDDPASTLGPA